MFTLHYTSAHLNAMSSKCQKKTDSLTFFSEASGTGPVSGTGAESAAGSDLDARNAVYALYACSHRLSSPSSVISRGFRRQALSVCSKVFCT